MENDTSSILASPVEATPRLDQLAREIRVEHDACEARMRDSLVHARRAGELLWEVKATVEHGQFGRWIEAHCGFTWRTGNLYMKIARQWDTLVEQNSQSIATLSLGRAAELLTVSDPGEHAAEVTTLEELGILVPVDLDGLSPREVGMVVSTLKRAYDEMCEDPARGKRFPSWDDPAFDKHTSPKVMVDPLTLRSYGRDAIAALKCGTIGGDAFAQVFVGLKKGEVAHVRRLLGLYVKLLHHQVHHHVAARRKQRYAAEGEAHNDPGRLMYCMSIESYQLLVEAFLEATRERLAQPHVLAQQREMLEALVTDVRAALDQLERNMRVVAEEIVTDAP